MSESSEVGDVRDLVRRAILEVLQDELPSTSYRSRVTAYEQRVPAQREVTLVLRGSERAVGLLQSALADGEQLLEVASGERFGPKARVSARFA